MQLVKEFLVDEMRIFPSLHDRQCELIQRHHKRQSEKEWKSWMILDTATCVTYAIPLSTDLVGKIIIYTLVSHDLPLQIQGGVPRIDYSKLEVRDDLVICLLEKKEMITPVWYTLPPTQEHDVMQRLILSTRQSGGTISVLPVPFYHLLAELTDQEYEACKALPVTSVFKIYLALKQEK